MWLSHLAPSPPPISLFYIFFSLKGFNVYRYIQIHIHYTVLLYTMYGIHKRKTTLYVHKQLCTSNSTSSIPIYENRTTHPISYQLLHIMYVYKHYHTNKGNMLFVIKDGIMKILTLYKDVIEIKSSCFKWVKVIFKQSIFRLNICGELVKSEKGM